MRRRFRRNPGENDSRKIRNLGFVACPGYCPKNLSVPGTHFLYLIRNEIKVKMLDRNVKSYVLRDFQLDTVGKHRRELMDSGRGWGYLSPCGTELRLHGRDVPNDESQTIQHRPFCTASRVPFPKTDQHTWEKRIFQRTGFYQLPAESIDPDPLLSLGVRTDNMHMSHGHPRGIWRSYLA
jgi:hypothetical protein